LDDEIDGSHDVFVHEVADFLNELIAGFVGDIVEQVVTHVLDECIARCGCVQGFLWRRR